MVALALGVVMAGTGHLPTLKLLRGGSAFLNTSLLPLLAPIVASHSPPPPPQPQTPKLPSHSLSCTMYPTELSSSLCFFFQLIFTLNFLPVSSYVFETCVLCFGLHPFSLQLDPIHLHCIS